MQNYSVAIDWATLNGEPETTVDYVKANSEDEAIEILREQVSKEPNFWKTQGGSAMACPDR